MCFQIHTNSARACSWCLKNKKTTNYSSEKRIQEDFHNLETIFLRERMHEAKYFLCKQTFHRINFPHRTTHKEIIKWFGSLLLFIVVVLLIKSFLLCFLPLSLIGWHTHATLLGFNNLLSNTLLLFRTHCSACACRWWINCTLVCDEYDINYSVITSIVRLPA